MMTFLSNVFYQCREMPGWISWLEDVLPESDIAILEKMDDNFIDFLSHYKKTSHSYGSEIRKKINQLRAETDSQYIKDCRKRYLENEISRLEQEIKEIYIEYYMNYKQDNHYIERLLLMESIKPLEKRLKRLSMELHLIENPLPGRITPEMIANAKAFPFEELVETKKGFILCPFHEEKRPSFYIRRNFGYCFSCGKTADTIQYVMQTQKLSFPQAVKQLNGIEICVKREKKN